jgi:hypothetical protein
MSAPAKPTTGKRVHPVDELLPVPKLATYGFQHRALSNVDHSDHNDVVQLAAAYREHFGFPLIVCARETGHFDRVLKNGWSRIDNSPAAERAFALIEVEKIANYRFTDLVADANPIAAARFSRLNELQ